MTGSFRIYMLNEEVKYGGFWVRLVASIIDDIIISLIIAVSSFIISMLIVSFDSQSPLAVYLFSFFNSRMQRSDRSLSCN